MTSRRLLVVPVVATLVAGLVPPAAAAPLSVTTTLSPAGEMAQSAVIDGGPNGDLVAAWTVGPPKRAVLQVARRPSGGHWSKPVTVSRPGAEWPDLDVGPGGRACLAWEQRQGPEHRAQASCFRPGKGWSAVRSLTPAGSDSGSVQVAVHGAGATFVWGRYGARDRVQVARRSRAGHWAKATTLSAASVDATAPSLAVDGGGRATVVWGQSSSGGPRKAVVRREKAGGGWSPRTTLSPVGQGVVVPRIAEVAGGTALVVWTSADQSIWAAHRSSSGGGWTAALQLSPIGVSAGSPAVGANRTDDVFTVAWTAALGGGPAVQSVRRRDDGSWTLVHQVSTPGSAAVFAPDVVMDTQQFATIVWQEHDGAQYRIGFGRQSIIETWSATEYLDVASANGSYEPRVTISGTFDVGMVWRRYDASDKLRVQTRRFDPAQA